MNLPAHIITSSPPSMNLPAHGTASPDPSFTSQHDNENKKSTLRYTRYILKLVLGIPMLPRTCLFVVQLYEPPRSQSNSTDLPARSLTHVIHQLRTSSLATSLKFEHGTYEPPRSYPHTRISGYEPPRSYHHVFILVMNLPAHDNIKHIPDQDQHNKSCKTYHNASCHYTIAQRNLSTARRNSSTDRLTVTHHRRAPKLTRHSCFLLLPSGSVYTARRYTSNVTLLVLGTLIHFLEFNHSIIKHPEINIHIHIFQITTSQHMHLSSISTHSSLL